MFFTCFLLFVLIVAFYIYGNLNYWARNGVYHVSFIATMRSALKLFAAKKHISTFFREIYDDITKKGETFGVFHLAWKPVLMVADAKLTKAILAKDFRSFSERGVYYDQSTDPLSGNLFAYEYARWKPLRSRLSSMMSPKRLKEATTLIREHGRDLVHVIDGLVEGGVDIRGTISKFLADVMCSYVFGVESGCLKGKRSEFLEVTESIFNPGFVQSLKAPLFFLAPGLMRLLKITMFPSETIEFVQRMMRDTVKYRMEHNIRRNDFVQIMLDEMNVEDFEKLDLREITAQCYVMFLGGYETTSNVTTYGLFEMAKNIEIQDSLRNEIQEVLGRDEEVTYEKLAQMKYLDIVIKEILRKYPTLSHLNRLCTEDYKIPESNVVIKKGTPVVFSILGIHHDPENFPNPETFDPERFRNSGDHKIYMPFGDGPRICIGYSLALVLMKFMVVTVIRSFKLSVSPKTEYPLKLANNTFTITPLSSVILDCVKL